MMRTWCVGKWLASKSRISVHRAFSALPSQQIASTQDASSYRPVRFRTDESDPAKHSENDLGMFYRVPDADVSRMMSVHPQWRPSVVEQMKAFKESCIMVRRPALEVIQHLKNSDLTRPVVRYVLYGRHGAGKNMSLSHVMHYGASQNWVVFSMFYMAHWFKNVQESSLSVTRDGLIDLPFAGAKFLAHLKSLNPATFSTLVTTRDYEWTKREVTAKGSSLAQLADHGIQRIKFSNDVVVALAQELKANAIMGNCKLMVVVGAVNALWVGDSNYEKPERIKQKKIFYNVKDFTLAQAFFPLLSCDWSGGAVITSVSVEGVRPPERTSHYPRYLLKEEGFEALDPFVPVRVDPYDEKEFESCLDYYIDRRWLQNPAAKTAMGRKELEFLSSRNPLILSNIIAPL